MAAGLIVGTSIIGARLIAPYEISAVRGADGNPMVFRVNTITGDVESCALKLAITQGDPSQLSTLDEFKARMQRAFSIQCQGTLP